MMGAATALVTTAVLLAPAYRPPRPSTDDEHDLRELLDRWGDQDSLGYFALRAEKSLVFSPTRKAAVAYGVAGSVALASGDPVGDPEAWPGAIRAWLAQVEANGWVPGVLGAGEAAATAYDRAGLEVLELGDEAVLEVAEFTLEGRAMRGVRQAVSRVTRAGHTLQVDRQHDLTPAEVEEVRAAVTAMRDGDVERGFSMALGRLGDPRDPELMVARAREYDGRLVAVLVFAPWGREGLSLDVMRRVADADNGVVEFMIAGIVGRAAELGIQRISLNFAVFRSTFDRGSRIGAGPVLRLWRQVLLFASRWWQIESLYRANAKYRPIWVPRYLCYRRASELPRIGIAALEVEALVARPRVARLLRPRLGASAR
jgi:lysyl-tRNA synthetase class 2